MSSMRNAVQRRNHKERAQPVERQKWGLLEKHKDYSKRAADHNLKKRKIKALQAKASERNEDEFYFGMLSSSTVKGVKQAARGLGNGATGVLSRDTIALMKTQDVGYLRTLLQQTKLERQRLEKGVIIAETGVQIEPFNSGKVVFDEEGAVILATNLRRKITNDEDGIADDLAGLDDFSEGEDHDEVAEDPLSPERARKKHAKEVKRRKVEAFRDREEQLSLALREVETQRMKMNGSTGGINKNGVKFRVRQRRS